MSRFFARQFVLLVISFILVTEALSAAELKQILYGTTASPSHLPVWVAKDAGLFEKNGLNVEPVQIRGGSLITLAISPAIRRTTTPISSPLKPCTTWPTGPERLS